MTVRGATLSYEVVGQAGDWIILTPGGRSGLEVISPLAEKLAAGGHRVLLHDRRNCGASDVSISSDEMEDQMVADDVAELMSQVGATPALAVAVAGGNRTSFHLSLRHASILRGVVFCWPSGGRRAAEILAEDYYGRYAEVARQGGMAAVCETPYYRERIERRPANREQLRKIDAAEFIATMERWRQGFLASAEWPTVAVPESSVRSISVPTCVVAGLTDDPIHGRTVSEGLAGLIPNAELRYIPEERRPDDAPNSWLRDALTRRNQSEALVQEILRFSASLKTAV